MATLIRTAFAVAALGLISSLCTRARARALDQQLQLQLVGWNASTLLHLRQLIATDSVPTSLKPALAQLQRDAEFAVRLPRSRCPDDGPWSVTNNPLGPAPSGDVHDLFSYSTYAWPCNVVCNESDPHWPKGEPNCSFWWERRPPNVPAWPPNASDCNFTTGLPWYNHDGFGNPTGNYDEDCGIDMADRVETLALASFLGVGNNASASSSAVYMSAAVSALRTWFLDPETAMNPNLQFSSVEPPNYNGTSSGIIYATFRWNTRLVDSVSLLKAIANDSSLPTTHGWTASDQLAWEAWNTQFLHWLRTSAHGVAEGHSTNNHFSWYATHVLALLLGGVAPSNSTTEAAEALAASIRDSPDLPGALAHQILPSGQMPKETARADSITYSCMNMAALLALATAADHTPSGAGLWAWPGNQSGYGAMRNALDFLLPFATGDSEWPYSQASGDRQVWINLAPQLRQAALLSGNASYEAAIARLPWHNGTWPGAWQADISQLLWPAPEAFAETR